MCGQGAAVRFYPSHELVRVCKIVSYMGKNNRYSDLVCEKNSVDPANVSSLSCTIDILNSEHINDISCLYNYLYQSKLLASCLSLLP